MFVFMQSPLFLTIWEIKVVKNALINEKKFYKRKKSALVNNALEEVAKIYPCQKTLHVLKDLL